MVIIGANVLLKFDGTVWDALRVMNNTICFNDLSSLTKGDVVHNFVGKPSTMVYKDVIYIIGDGDADNFVIAYNITEDVVRFVSAASSNTINNILPYPGSTIAYTNVVPYGVYIDKMVIPQIDDITQNKEMYVFLFDPVTEDFSIANRVLIDDQSVFNFYSSVSAVEFSVTIAGDVMYLIPVFNDTVMYCFDFVLDQWYTVPGIVDLYADYDGMTDAPNSHFFTIDRYTLGYFIAGSTELYIYDIRSSTWDMITLSQAVVERSASIFINNTLYLYGGINEASEAVNDMVSIHFDFGPCHGICDDGYYVAANRCCIPIQCDNCGMWRYKFLIYRTV